MKKRLFLPLALATALIAAPIMPHTSPAPIMPHIAPHA